MVDRKTFPPPESDDDFQWAIQRIVKRRLSTIEEYPVGRNGQQQDGIDIIAKRRDGTWIGIQCKHYLRTKLTRKLLDSDLIKAHHVTPRLSQFIVATSHPADAKLQAWARDALLHRKHNVKIWFWSELTESIARDPKLIDKILNLPESTHERILSARHGGRRSTRQISEFLRGPEKQGKHSEKQSNAHFDLPDAIWRPGFGDAALLRPEEAAMPFHQGSDKHLDELLSWVTTPGKGILVKTWAGPAGVGKTRLLLEACAILRRKGWEAGFLRTSPPSDDLSSLSKWWRSGIAPRLVVVDYAEARPTEVICLFDSLVRSSAKRKIRIVLLSRNIGVWWQELLIRSKSLRAMAQGDAYCGSVVITPIAAGTENAMVQYQSALAVFSRLLKLRHENDNHRFIPDFLFETHGKTGVRDLFPRWFLSTKWFTDLCFCPAQIPASAIHAPGSHLG